MPESKTENELLKVAGLKPKKGEERQAYLIRLLKAVSDPKKVTDDIWEGLTKESQDWTNAAAEEYKAGRPVEDFTDYEEEDDDPPVDEEVNEEEEEAPPPVKTKAKKEEKPKAAKSESAPTRKVSACHMIKKIVVKDPKITVADLSAQLKEQGLKVSDVTISTLRSDLRDTLRVMNELKMCAFEL